MDKYLNKAKSKFQDKIQPLLQDRNGSNPHHNHNGPPPIPPKPQIPLTSQQADRPSSITPVTPLDVLRYRYQHGANLGAIYVLEKWLFPGMFPGSCSGHGKSSELEAVRASVAELGVDGARDKFERHWAGAVTDADLDWLVGKAKCNTIRLPIGYFTLGPFFLDHDSSDPFHAFAPVYANAWASVRQLVARLRARGIGTLLDLHGIPGGANGCDHSGTNSGRAEHWHSRPCRDRSAHCLAWIAEQVRGDSGLREGVVGLQVCNEAEWGAKGLWEWYDGVVRAVASVEPGLPVYVSDAWDLGKALEWAKGANSVGVGARVSPVVVDTHLYWCFTDGDKKKGPGDIVREARGKLGQLDGKEGDVLKNGAVAVIIGEYSCVLSEETWKKGGDKSKDEWVREFGQALSKRFQDRALGSHFWTYKMQWMPGGEWGFKSCTNRGAITPHWTLTLGADDVRQRLESALAQKDERFGRTFGQHCGYWDNNSPGTPFEHWRYEQGWKQGFDDAAAFFGMRINGGFGDVNTLGEGGEGGGVGGDKIGNLEIWVRRRLIESGMGGPFVWEYEQGLRKGVGEFCELAGGL